MGPAWVASDDFDLERQIATHTLADGTDADIVARLAARMGERLDPELPPWQVSVWSGSTCHGLLLRWHHSLSDAEGIFQLLGALTDADVEPDPNRDLRRLNPALRGEFKPHARGTGRMRASELLWKMARQRRATTRVLGSEEFRVLPILEQIDAPMLARLHARWRVSTNDLLIGLASGAVARYEQRLGRSISSLRVLNPISDRDQYTDVQLGNYSRALRPTIELGESLPSTAELMARVHAATREQIERGQAAPYGVYRLVFGLPHAARDRLFAKAPKYIVNFAPWAAEAQWIAGARIERITGLTPMLPFHGCTFACTSYLGRLNANLVCDAQLIEQPQLMVTCMHEALADALRDA